VSLQSANVAIRVNPLYKTAALDSQTFVLWIAERGNWLFVRVTPQSEPSLRSIND